MEKLTDERFAEIRSDKETCEFCTDGDNDKACLGCKKINPATATELRLFWKELSALVKARDEGRVVVLPCKVGEWLYYLLDDKVRKAKVEEIQCSANKHNLQFDVTVFAWDFSAKEQLTYCPAGDSWTDNSRGFARVFLTRAEAEAALGGGVGG